jgi:demethylmenaquinone methyltransferase / 2-methoxy-6-polyprenyl-1,4-benzoquinol methylase
MASADVKSPNARAWTPAELADPHANARKQEKVGQMFSAIARRYDLNNRLHSLWRDQAWRRYAVRQAAIKPTDVVLDVACGTGDLTEAMAAAGAARVTGLDYTPAMLDVARHRLQSKRRRGGEWGETAKRITYMQGDAQSLPFDNASVDVVSIAFGIRNVGDPLKAIREFRRVLRPSGRLVILEFGTPTLAPVRWFNDLYCKRIMPITATLISGDRSGAYKYLPKSVESFMTTAQMCSALESAGFAQVRATSLTLGICWCYRGEVR